MFVCFFFFKFKSLQKNYKECSSQNDRKFEFLWNTSAGKLNDGGTSQLEIKVSKCVKRASNIMEKVKKKKKKIEVDVKIWCEEKWNIIIMRLWKKKENWRCIYQRKKNNKKTQFSYSYFNSLRKNLITEFRDKVLRIRRTLP